MTNKEAITYLEFLKVVRSRESTAEQVIKQFEILKVAGLLDAKPNQVDNEAFDKAIDALRKIDLLYYENIPVEDWDLKELTKEVITGQRKWLASIKRVDESEENEDEQ